MSATAAIGHDALLPRPAGGLLPGAVLALLVHAVLLAALTLGVQWRQQDAPVFSAELWSALPQNAAPAPVESSPPPPRPVPAQPPPPAVAPGPTAADIAIDKARDAKEARQRAADEAARNARRDADEAAQKKLQLAKEKAAEEKALEAQRQANLQRILGQAGASGGPAAAGTAARDAAPSAAYAGRLIALIRPKIRVLDRLPATLETVVEVRTSPGGTILSRRISKSSGNPVWDDAVLRAIDSTATLPRDTDGRIPPTIEISFRPE
jgi:colicin import membrane protein